MAGRTVRAVHGPSLTDQVPAVYAFCREHLFRDDTERIIAALWPEGGPPAGTKLVELGCGPGFYARRLAARFRDLTVIGLDRSMAQLAQAEARLVTAPLPNCRYDLGDATALPYLDDSIDAVVAARLLANVERPERVIAEVHRVLRPGGRCFVAEPRSRLRAAVPIALMRIAAQLAGSASRGAGRGSGGRGAEGRHERHRAAVLDGPAYAAVVGSQPWRRASHWVDGPYQYALLEKAEGR